MACKEKLYDFVIGKKATHTFLCRKHDCDLLKVCAGVHTLRNVNAKTAAFVTV